MGEPNQQPQGQMYDQGPIPGSHESGEAQSELQEIYRIASSLYERGLVASGINYGEEWLNDREGIRLFFTATGEGPTGESHIDVSIQKDKDESVRIKAHRKAYRTIEGSEGKKQVKVVDPERSIDLDGFSIRPDGTVVRLLSYDHRMEPDGSVIKINPPKDVDYNRYSVLKRKQDEGQVLTESENAKMDKLRPIDEDHEKSRFQRETLKDILDELNERAKIEVWAK